jgi:outer membrane protein assembly factor BamB
MKHISRLLSILMVASICYGGDWRQFRGDDSNSVSSEQDLPTFAEGTAPHVCWKAPLPGRGPAGPIIIGDRAVVTCSSGNRQDRLHVLCFDVASGRQLWQRQFWATGATAGPPFGAVAAPTPASDGQLIFAFFGSNDLACFDLEGNLRWLRGLGLESPAARIDTGMASSPLVIGPTVIVQMEGLGDALVTGIDTATGETRWQLQRQRETIWSSPTLLRGKTPADDLLLLQSRDKLTAHDPQTGKQLWEYAAACHTIASVTTCGNGIYLPAIGLHALRYDPATRAVTKLWYQDRLRSDNCSPVVADGRAYVIKPPGILMCADASDGKTLWQLRLTGPFWATPLLAGGYLYCVNHPGLLQVVQLGSEGKLAGTFPLDEGMLASPAAARGALYFRSDKNLWKITAP